ncbi:hypothetical protein ACIQW4_33930 [Streptomyces albogriseolus]|uniref:hypothetical protein n=1 Tax=Streptomyces TaxID=1883 RepID=UPI00159ED578|nr:hypothetical protein [Streptomyces sp. F-7]
MGMDQFLAVRSSATGDSGLTGAEAGGAVGLFFETVGDAQLACFKADRANRGRIRPPRHRHR